MKLLFGSFDIEIKLEALERSHHTSFSFLHTICGTKLEQVRRCPSCKRIVEPNEINKGISTEDSVILHEDVKLDSNMKNTIVINGFTSKKYIPQILRKKYYVAYPKSKSSEVSYDVIRRAMTLTHLVGVGKQFTLNREYNAIIEPNNNVLLVCQLYYEDEIKPILTRQNTADMPDSDLLSVLQAVRKLRVTTLSNTDETEEELREFIGLEKVDENSTATISEALKTLQTLKTIGE